jgi:hypothetical protein
MPRSRRSPAGRIGPIGALIVLVVAVAIFFRLRSHRETPSAALAAGRVRCSQVAAAFHQNQSGAWLTMAGHVSALLPDEHGTSTHQRFILRCPSGQTVLVDNNVDVGRRAALTMGEYVVVRGQFVWNSQGGLLHDTHHSTSGNPDGWVFAGGRVYQ